MKTTAFLLVLVSLISSPSFAVYQCGESYQQHLPTYMYSNDRLAAAKIESFLSRPEALSASEVRLSAQDRVLVRSILFTVMTEVATKPMRKLLGIDKKIVDLGVERTTDFENKVLDLFASMVEQKTLRPYLLKLIRNAKEMPIVGSKLSGLTEEKINKMLKIVVDAIETMVWVRGKVSAAKHIKYREWEDINKEIEAKLNLGLSLEQLAKTKFEVGTNVRILKDGPESFSLREKLLSEAESSVDILLWSVENDITGTDLANRLMALKLAKPYVKIRIMVDGRTSHRIGYTEQLKRLEDSGLVEVIRWHDALQPYAGQHMKMFIIDGTHLISGGMNAGDAYSHKGPDPKLHWRDTDVYVAGHVVNQANSIFAEMWNKQVRSHRLPLESMPTAKAKEVEGPETTKVAIIQFQPNSQIQTGSPIMMAMLKTIEGAHTSIEISNAYLMALPPIANALERAIKRGVKVRALTNSPDSTDEPIVGKPVLRSALQLAALGAEVYSRVGTTLHTKTMVVDSQQSFIMSYNLHPASERLETEVAVLIDNANIGQQMTRMFEADLDPRIARRLDPTKEEVKDDAILFLTLRILFDRL